MSDVPEHRGAGRASIHSGGRSIAADPCDAAEGMQRDCRARVLFWVIGGVITVAIALNAVVYPIWESSLGSDYWLHVAVIREWSANLTDPATPTLGTDLDSARFTPVYFVLSAASRVFGLSPETMMALGGIAGMLVLLAGIYSFFRVYFDSALAPVFGLGLTLACWGIGVPWANLFQLRSLLLVAAYPSTFAFGFALLGGSAALSMLRKRLSTGWGSILVGALVAVTLLTHPLNGAFAVGIIGLAVLFEAGADRTGRTAVVAAVAAGVVVAAVWPFYSVWGLIAGRTEGVLGPLGDGGRLPIEFYHPGYLFALLGPAVAGAWALARLARRRRHHLITIGFLGTFLLYEANVVVPVPLGHRFLFFAVFFLHLAITAVALPWVEQGGPERGRTLLIGIGGVAVAWNLLLAATHVGGTVLLPFEARDIVYGPDSLVGQVRHLVEPLPGDAVVLGPALDSWPVPAYGPNIAVLLRGDPFVADVQERYRDGELFFSAEATGSDRQMIIERYGATHLLYREGENVPQGLTELGASVERTAEFVLVTLPPRG